MENHFTQITDTAELDRLIEQSHQSPVVLFKHSSTCPISAAAYRQMTRFSEADVWLVVVQQARDLSREIEARTGVRHESPQVLILKGGEVAWSASHFDITSGAVERAVGEHS
jgi:bacillithiol system protein YtxJ